MSDPPSFKSYQDEIKYYCKQVRDLTDVLKGMPHCKGAVYDKKQALIRIINVASRNNETRVKELAQSELNSLYKEYPPIDNGGDNDSDGGADDDVIELDWTAAGSRKMNTAPTTCDQVNDIKSRKKYGQMDDRYTESQIMTTPNAPGSENWAKFQSYVVTFNQALPNDAGGERTSVTNPNEKFKTIPQIVVRAANDDPFIANTQTLMEMMRAINVFLLKNKSSPRKLTTEKKVDVCSDYTTTRTMKSYNVSFAFDKEQHLKALFGEATEKKKSRRSDLDDMSGYDVDANKKPRATAKDGSNDDGGFNFDDAIKSMENGTGAASTTPAAAPTAAATTAPAPGTVPNQYSVPPYQTQTPDRRDGVPPGAPLPPYQSYATTNGGNPAWTTPSPNDQYFNNAQPPFGQSPGTYTQPFTQTPGTQATNFGQQPPAQNLGTQQPPFSQAHGTTPYTNQQPPFPQGPDATQQYPNQQTNMGQPLFAQTTQQATTQQQQQQQPPFAQTTQQPAAGGANPFVQTTQRTSNLQQQQQRPFVRKRCPNGFSCADNNCPFAHW